MKSMFGNIRKLPSGRYQARYTHPDTGEQVTAPHTFDRKGAAHSWLTRQKAAIDTGKTPPDHHTRKPIPTIEQTGQAYLNELKTTRDPSPNTLISLDSILRTRINPTFGHARLTQVTPDQVNDWYATLTQRYAPNTVKDTYALLKRLYAYAARHEITDHNPCRVNTRTRRTQNPVTSDQVATPTQVHALTQAMPERLALTVQLAAWCAMRQGEILALTAGDFQHLDTPTPTVTISKQVIQKTGEIGATKNRDTRTITIPAALIAPLTAHMGNVGATEPHRVMFPASDVTQTPVHHNTLRAAWNRARTIVGLPHFKFHDLRHTGLTLFAQQGATYAELMHRGGHKDISVALRYQHWTIERDRALTKKLNNLIAP